MSAIHWKQVGYLQMIQIKLAWLSENHRDLESRKKSESLFTDGLTICSPFGGKRQTWSLEIWDSWKITWAKKTFHEDVVMRVNGFWPSILSSCPKTSPSSPWFRTKVKGLSLRKAFEADTSLEKSLKTLCRIYIYNIYSIYAAWCLRELCTDAISMRAVQSYCTPPQHYTSWAHWYDLLNRTPCPFIQMLRHSFVIFRVFRTAFTILVRSKNSVNLHHIVRLLPNHCPIVKFKQNTSWMFMRHHTM